MAEKDPVLLPEVRKLLEVTAGIELVLNKAGKKEHQLAGDLIIMTGRSSWFTYNF